MKNGYLSIAGLVLMIPILAMTISGSVPVADALTRGLVLVVMLLVLDRVVIPLGKMLTQFLEVPTEEASEQTR